MLTNISLYYIVTTISNLVRLSLLFNWFYIFELLKFHLLCHGQHWHSPVVKQMKNFQSKSFFLGQILESKSY